MHLESRTGMGEVTQILKAIEGGDPKAADELLLLVYEELRLLAAQKMAQEKPGQTLQATALVHEAYLRLVGDVSQSWESKHQILTWYIGYFRGEYKHTCSFLRKIGRTKKGNISA